MLDPRTIPYRRSRFSTRLPSDRLYAPSHYWLLETEPGVWSVGFTRFATRMLGDLVELNFAFQPGQQIEVGQTMGSIEGFKAVTDLYCVAAGEFLGGNPGLDRDITLSDTQPYDAGWLYRVRGTPDPNAVDVEGYIQLLDLTIDQMRSATPDDAEQQEDDTCPS